MRRPFQVPERTVYLIGELVSSVAKIGYSDGVALRLETIQAYSPVKLHVLATVEGNIPFEKGLHRRFAACRLWGEWFDFGDLDRVEAFLSAAEEIKADWRHYESTLETAAYDSDSSITKSHGFDASSTPEQVAMWAVRMACRANPGLSNDAACRLHASTLALAADTKRGTDGVNIELTMTGCYTITVTSTGGSDSTTATAQIIDG